ncbi:MAG: type I phosphomannose isomerase catalytic subunit [Ruminococcus sp.]
MNTAKKTVPFLLKPVGKDYLWGGERLSKEFGKDCGMNPLAETWECSTHPDGISIVDSGIYAGRNLKEVLEKHPEYLGNCSSTDGELPIMIKLIDAQQNLSVQVHPDDDYAKTNENGQNGKTEMWYILDAAPDAHLVYGFRQAMSKSELQQHLENGTIEPYLNWIPVKKGDVFFIKAGTVHAIGAGILLAEIQQSSNLTYRLYDYNRTDHNGNKRQLHIKKALEVIDMSVSLPNDQPHTVKKEHGSCIKRLSYCQYFQAEQIIIKENEDICTPTVPSSEKFQVLLCADGSGKIDYGAAETLAFSKGDCIFIPANINELQLYGNAELLRVTV